MRAPLFLISLLLSSAACSDAKQFGEKTGVEPQAKTGAATTARAAATAKSKGGAFAFSRKLTEPGGGEMDFAYSWPAEVGAEPRLVEILKKDLKSNFDSTRTSWEGSFAECPKDAASCRNYSYDNAYKVVANLPQFLSLSTDFSNYTGGAHGMYGKSSTIWDRQAGTMIEPQAMFVSSASLSKALRSRACAALDAERLKRRGEQIGGDTSEWPNDCPNLDDAELFVGSSNGRTFDRLGLYYGPYVAGPYAEGAYEIDLPVDAAVLAAVKPEYRDAFSVKR